MPTDTVAPKLWWQSKTIWVSFLALVAAAIQSKYGWILPPEYQTYGLAILMAILRFLTKQPVTFS